MQGVIAELEAQLQQAQEYVQELEVQRDSSDRHAANLNQERIALQAERDEAIGRGEQAYRRGCWFAGLADIFRRDLDAMERRAEAAEDAARDAYERLASTITALDEQRTRAEAAEALVNRLVQLEKLRRLGHQTDARFDEVAEALAQRRERSIRDEMCEYSVGDPLNQAILRVEEADRRARRGPERRGQ